MLHQRWAAVAAAFVAAVASPVLTATSADARVAIPWTDQTVFAIGPTDNYVAEWMGLSEGWTIIGGPASEIFAGSAGVFATDPTTGNIYEYNGTPGSWTEIGGPGAQFAEGDGHLYGLGPDYSYVAEWNGPGLGWSMIGGPASSIYAGPDGLAEAGPWNSNMDIWHYNGTPDDWTDIGGPQAALTLNDVAVGANGVYRVDPVNAGGITVLDEWTGGTTWTPILTVASPNELSNLIVGDDGVYVEDISTTTDVFLKYSGTPDNWSQIASRDYYGNGLTPIAESRTSLFGVNLDTSDGGTASDVEIYSGTGSSWTVIGGPANPNLGAGD
jgi:hypothetical protein